MPTVYQRQIETAFKLIDKKGMTVTQIRKETVVDPITQEPVTNDVTQEVRAVVLPVTSTKNGLNDEDLANLRESSVRKLLVAGASFITPDKPDPADLFDLGSFHGPDWKVYGMNPLAPDGTPILYSIILFR